MPMQPWFPDAKLGIFIHYGVYAVGGAAESWSFYTGEMTHDQYMKQLGGFTASHYDPDAWAELFARVGARYAVLTTKHHDGVALWDTDHRNLDVVRDTPAGRDLVTGFVDALRARNLKVGLYYSHSDWNHPDYPTERHPGPHIVPANGYSHAEPGREDPEAWARYLTYRDGQVRELVERFRPDILWFDGEWERTEEQWRMRDLADLILSGNPDTILNGRMLSYGDYATPEQGAPLQAPDGPWELCLTINDSWSYRPHDHDFKSVRQLVRYFAETIGMGGNLLLGAGPREDGTIPEEQIERMEGLGAWIARHSDAVYDTVAGLPAGHHYGPSTLSADRRTLYLMCFDSPRETVSIRGLRNQVKRVTVLGTGTELSHHVTGGLGDVPGVTWIEAPAQADLDPYATVLAVELEGELDLYRGAGRN